MKDNASQLTFSSIPEDSRFEQLIRKNSINLSNHIPLKKSKPMPACRDLNIQEYTTTAYTIEKGSRTHQATYLEYPSITPSAMHAVIQRALERISSPLN